jgi:uncharacterized protein (DUF362 family)/Pyruvate/2-oxoacid:ferredoxin oxidoreductase delta subunit
MSEVVLVRCESYDSDAVLGAVRRVFEELGGVRRFVRPGERILLKPNLVVAEPPERCTTTHPAVFTAVAAVLMEAGALLSYGDSPAIGNLRGAARKSGLKPAADRLGVALADFQTGREVYFQGGRQNRKFVLARGVLDCDGLISLPKLKTHGLEKMTGAIKNQFGCVPGVLKAEYHVKLPDASDFARMLVDLDRLVHPRLYVMDGIMAMEGNGPRSGNSRAMNLLAASRDPVALDATICRLIQLNPDIVPTIRWGRQHGAGTDRIEDIRLVGDPPQGFVQADFDVDRSPVKPFGGKWIQRHLNDSLVARPAILPQRCIRCGLCVQMCPTEPKAVNWWRGDQSRPPVHDYRGCIRCYCCQEICPEGAIVLEVPLLRKVLNRVAAGLTAPQRFGRPNR